MFQRYRLESHGDDEYTITLYLSPALEEFAKELGEEERDTRMGLEDTVRRFLRERFPDLKVTGAKIMMGTMLVSTLSLGGSALTAGSAEAAPPLFKDIGGSYAQQQITALAKAGVISGMPDGTFQPTETMTRDQFAVLLAKMMKLPLGEQAPLDGVSEWAAPYVSAVVKAGYMHGIDEHNFGGSDTITREQIATIFVRAMGMEQQARVFNETAKFSDTAAVSEWARPYVAFAQHIGFIQGSPDENGTFRFNPQQAAQRQEVSVMAHNYFFAKGKYVDVANDMIQTSAPRIRSVHGFVNSINQQAFTVEGTGKAGEKVALSISDGTDAVTTSATVGAGGLYQVTVDASRLQEGPLTLKAVLTDADGKTRTGDVQISKDTVAQMPVITNTNNIDDTNKLSYVVEGTGEAGAQLIVYATDERGNRAEAFGTVNADGNFAVPVDATKLLDGSVKLSINLLDRAGNATATVDSRVTVQKQVEATLAAPQMSTDGPLTRENAPRYHIWGTYPGPRTTFHTGIENAQGEDLIQWRSMVSGGTEYNDHWDLTSLPQGSYNLKFFVTDIDGNTSPVTRVPVVKDF